MTSAMEASFPVCWRWRLQETMELMSSCHHMELEVSELHFLQGLHLQEINGVFVIIIYFLLHLYLHSHGAAVQ